MRRKLRQIKTAELPLVKFYEPHHHILRNKNEYTKLAFNNGIFTFLNRMKFTAAQYKLVYLTGPQVYSHQNVFIIKKDFKDHKWIDQSYTNAQTYRGFINPKIDQFIGQKTDSWQRCMATPYIEFKVQRYPEIKVSYTNENRENVSEQMIGFKARVYQHCIDHVNGKCALDWNVCRGNIRVYPQAEDLFPKTAFVLKQYTMRVKDAISKRKQPSQQLILSEQEKKFQQKQEEYIRKALSQEINSFSEKYNRK